MNKIIMNEVIEGINFDKLESNIINIKKGESLVLYLNASYFRNVEFNLDEDAYLEINKINDRYLIEFMYNYAKIEAMVYEEDINDVVLNSTYILSTIKFNKNVIKLMLNDEYFVNKEEKYDIFSSKIDVTDNLEYHINNYIENKE